MPGDKSADFKTGYLTGYEQGIEAERELMMGEFKHKYQMEPFDIPPERLHQPEPSSQKNGYLDRYQGGRNELYESPRPHKLIGTQEDAQPEL